ncbi:MAG: rod shape-determining protein MreC [Campylobacterales bacterium]|nr:rod shape-determining protein MreC [Campylobacterales bacterium]
MKTRVVFFFIVLFLVVLFASKENSYVKDKILLLTTPIKEFYTQSISDIAKFKEQYLHQQKSIEQLSKENQQLKAYLIEQTNYLNQIDKLFDVIPSLERLPHKSITLVQPIGYAKLNSYSTILLNRPKEISQDRIYGLMKNSSIIGTAQLSNGILYGHLLASSSCRFSVHVGKVKAPGVAIGQKDGTLKIEYIPKWSKIKEGDIVETSGVDKIFFANVPVGKVKSIKVKSSYKTAVVEPFVNYLDIDYLFLIHDPSPTLVSQYDAANTKLYPYIKGHFGMPNTNTSENNKSVNGDVVQTTVPEVNPKEHETPTEESDKPKVKKTKPLRADSVPSKPKLPQGGLDMF